MRIAVIGTGISGISAAWGLKDRAEIILYESRERPGGHSATVDVNYDGTSIAVDTGFIVYNELNYPNLTEFFAHLGVATKSSAMSFAVSSPGRRNEWSANSVRALFATKRNLVSPSFLWMLKEILRFNDQSKRDLSKGLLDGLSLGDYLTKRQFSGRFSSDYLIPMGAAIWSTPDKDVLRFPAESFIAFFINHRLVNWSRPEWRTVVGGSREYVAKALGPFAGRIRYGAKVKKVRRTNGRIVVTDGSGQTDSFDHVVLATHSDQALGMLEGASPDERHILSSIRYRPNDVYLHRDPVLMPRRKNAWSSWNYLQARGSDNASKATVTYWMNKLQDISADTPLFVTLNPASPPRSELTFGRYTYDHPQFDRAALDALAQIGTIQGVGGVWYAGAYQGSGFHEDGFRSGLAVAEALGGHYPWRKRPLIHAQPQKAA